jgi:hypothetical protein
MATIVDGAPGVEDVVDRALGIRQLRSRHVRDQIVAELPLALANVIRPRRADDDRADVAAIVRSCEERPSGLHELLRVVRQFAGDSAEVDDLKRAIRDLGQA